MSRLLLVTADDFGLTEGVCHAIVGGHRNGVVTSTSMLAVGRAYPTAVALARETPSLAVGVHLAAVGEDPPLLAASEIPSLVDRTGHFPLTYRSFLRRAALGWVDVEDVRREFRAQVQRLIDDGLTPSHLDTHQHLHLWPPVAGVVTELAVSHDIPAVRVPRSRRRSPLGTGINVLSRLLTGRLDKAGLIHTDDFAGLDQAGALDRGFRAALDHLSHGKGLAAVEINTHPGQAADPDLSRFDWGYRWERELDLLLDPVTRELVHGHGFRLGSYVDLVRES